MKILLTLTVVFALRLVPAAAEDVRMLYIAQAGYQPRDIQTRAEEYRRETGREIRLFFSQYEDIYALILESAAKTRADYDIVLADMIWIDDYDSRGILSPVPQKMAEEIRQGMVLAVRSPFEIEGELRAYPFLANLQLLYLNRGLLQRTGYTGVPASLEDMTVICRAAKRLGIIKYPLFDSWRKQEALVCEFTTIVGAFGGRLTDAEGRPKVDNPECVQALRFMVSLLDEGLMNPYSLQSDEVFAADAFLKGDVLFQTNWTFVTGLMHDGISTGSKKLEAALIPAARAVKPWVSTASVSGYQGLAVPQNSTRKDEAWSFIQYLAAPAFQRRHLSEMSVWESVWSEERTRQIDPNIDLKRIQLAGALDRIRNASYHKISLILQGALYQALNRAIPADRALTTAQEKIEALE